MSSLLFLLQKLVVHLQEVMNKKCSCLVICVEPLLAFLVFLFPLDRFFTPSVFCVQGAVLQTTRESQLEHAAAPGALGLGVLSSADIQGLTR